MCTTCGCSDNAEPRLVSGGESHSHEHTHSTVMNTVTTMSTLTVTAMTMSTVMITVTNIAMS